MAWINGEEVPDSQLSGISAYTEFYDRLDTRKRGYWETVDQLLLEHGFEHPTVVADEWGVLEAQPGLPCPFTFQKFSSWPVEQCQRGAGKGTPHEGVGLCSVHKGNAGRGKAEGAILMARAFADELNVTPWEALLSQVRLLANQVQWLRLRVEYAEAEHGVDAIKPGGPGWEWVCLLEARGDRLAKVSKMAIDAGVAEKLVTQMNLEAEHMVTAAIATFELLGIYGDQRDEALEYMGRQLMALESGSLAGS